MQVKCNLSEFWQRYMRIITITKWALKTIECLNDEVSYHHTAYSKWMHLSIRVIHANFESFGPVLSKIFVRALASKADGTKRRIYLDNEVISSETGFTCLLRLYRKSIDANLVRNKPVFVELHAHHHPYAVDCTDHGIFPQRGQLFKIELHVLIGILYLTTYCKLRVNPVVFGEVISAVGGA